jgi:Raf kinase inhibitor-like YbhB/YbcL family protein
MRYLSFIFSIFSVFFIAGFFAEITLADEAVNTFSLASTSFPDKGSLPTLYTCDGKNISPQLSWTTPPAGTKSFALVLSDLDAPSGIFYHWILYNIPVTIKEIPENAVKLPGKIITAKNSWGKAHYQGPCPPHGSIHNYLFTLYALNAMLQIKGKSETETIFTEIKKHTLKSVTQTAIYTRWLK